MHYVYVLKSHMRHPLYIGVTNNLRRRLKEHNEGASAYTSKSSGWELVYYEAYRNVDDAEQREKSLKQYGSAYGQLKRRIMKSVTS